MGFGRRTPRPDGATGQPPLAGRATQLGEYIKNFDLPPDHPDVRLITNLSGIGGVGKSFLLKHFLDHDPQRTISAVLDSPDEIGGSVVNLLRAISRHMRHQGQHKPLERLEKACDKWEDLARKAEARKSDVPAQVFEILYGAVRLGVEKVTTTSTVEAMDKVAPREQAVALLDAAGDKLATLFASRDDRELVREPKRVLTHALVQDLNDLGDDDVKIVLVFDNYEALSDFVNPWLLDHLLGLERDNIACDLRLIIAGRDPLTETDRRWRDVWQAQEDQICHFPLQVFTEDEAREFLEKSCGFTDPDDVAKICQMTDRLPLWLSLWLQAGASVESYAAAAHVKRIAKRIMQWFTDPQQRDWVEKAALCRWFDQPTLAALLADDDQARDAYDWLTSRRAIVRPHGDNFKLHDVICDVLSRHLDQRDPDLRHNLEERLAAHTAARLAAIAGREPDPSLRWDRQDWRAAVLDHLYYAWPGPAGLPLLRGYFAEAQWHALDFAFAMLSFVSELDRPASQAAANWAGRAVGALLHWAGGDHAALIPLLRDLTAVQALAPTQSARVHLRLGNSLSDLQDLQRPSHLEAAIAAYTAALEVYTRDDLPLDWAMTQNNLGTALKNRIRGDRADNLEAAIAAYTAALEVYTRDDLPLDWAMTQNNLGTAYADRIRGDRADNLEAAIAAYTAALEVYTRDDLPLDWAMTQNNLGTAYQERIRGDRADNLEAAIAAYTHVLEIHPENPWVFYHRAGVYDDLERYQQALDDLQAADRFQPENPWILNYLGSTYTSLDQHEQALDAYTAALAHAQDDESKAMFHRNRVGAQIELGRINEARQDCEAALALDPDSPYTPERFGDLYLALKQYDQALQSYQQAIEREPSAPRHFGLGLALLALGRLSEAQAAYQTALETADPHETQTALEELQKHDLDSADAILPLLAPPPDEPPAP